MHCAMFSSIPGLSPVVLAAKYVSGDKPDDPWGIKSPLINSHWFINRIWWLKKV